jgi:hypothetical protein
MLAGQTPQALQTAEQRGGSSQPSCVHALLGGCGCFCGCGETPYGGRQGCDVCCCLCTFETTMMLNTHTVIGGRPARVIHVAPAVAGCDSLTRVQVVL